MRKEEWKAWQTEGQVGMKDKLFSRVSLAVSCHLHQETCDDHQNKPAAEARASSCRSHQGPEAEVQRVLLPCDDLGPQPLLPHHIPSTT